MPINERLPAMRTFRPTYKDRKGKTQKSSKWHVAFTDHTALPRRLVAFTDKGASESFAKKVERLVAIRANRDPIPLDLSQWIDGLTKDTQGKLIGWGIIDGRASQTSRPLDDHIDEWRDDILNRGKTSAHAELLRQRVKRLFTDCGFTRYADIDPARVNQALAKMRQPQKSDDGVEHQGTSIQTTNHYARAAKQFCLWMVKNGRATSVPLMHLEMGNVATDRRYIRRALTIDEMIQLIKTAKASTVIRNCASGPERSLIYQLALSTGLRAKEIRTLTRDSFHLDSDKPTLTMHANNAKNRKADSFAIPSELAAILRLHLANKLPGARAFSIERYTARMIHADCSDAGIDIGPLTNRVDFHGNRKTFITNLGRAGVPLVMAQQLARHSDPRLTANVYTQFDNTEKRAAIEMLPKIAVAG